MPPLFAPPWSTSEASGATVDGSPGPHTLTGAPCGDFIHGDLVGDHGLEFRIDT
jgi:hypothetical protein